MADPQELHRLIDRLPENRLGCALKALTKLSTVGEPERLYHYTSVKGLLGILNEKAVWATKYCYLNDAKNRIKRQGLDVSLGPLDSANELYVSVFSLSTEPDLLSQWRAYCPPAGGYAIGFSVEKLRSLLLKRGEKPPDGPNFSLQRCVYDKHEQEDMIDKWLEKNRPTSSVKMIRLDKFIQEVGLSIKHHGFKEEHEWRVISRIISPDFNDINRKYGVEWKVRDRNHGLVDYMEIDLSDDAAFPIQEIVVGPCRDKELAEHAVKGMLKQMKMDHVETRKSDIPYRSG
jgi:hypothetical protein